MVELILDRKLIGSQRNVLQRKQVMVCIADVSNFKKGKLKTNLHYSLTKPLI